MKDRTWYRADLKLSNSGAEATTRAQQQIIAALRSALTNDRGSAYDKRMLRRVIGREGRMRECAPKWYRFTVFDDEYGPCSRALRGWSQFATPEYNLFMRGIRDGETYEI